MSDARFEDGDDAPLRLMAVDADDLKVLAALVQDAVFPAREMQYDRKTRSFGLLLNRFRWEDHARATAEGDFERVQSLLVIGDVLAVATDGVGRDDPDLVLSLLSMRFEAGQDGAGAVLLELAGDGTIRLEVECIDVILKDVTRPYLAPSRKMPKHPEE